MVEKKSKTQEIFALKKPWEHNDNDIWLASTLKLYRNVEKFLFASKLDEDRCQQIIALAGNELLSSKNLHHPALFGANDISPTEKEFLLEHYLGTQSFHQAHGGEAFIIDDTGLFLGVLNIGDHIQLQLTDCAGQLENAWNQLINIETALGHKLNYAFSPSFGFLTSDPAQCGTGLIVHIFLHLPALIHTNTFNDTLQKHHQDGVVITGLQGDPKNLIGDIVAVHNSFTLGMTEENIISTLRTVVTKLIVEEKSTRAKLRDNDDPNIKDLISRAFGLLRHSYQIETIEALNAISLLKLGVELGWISGVTVPKLNSLFMHCRRAHLISDDKEQTSPEEILHKRAELIHNTIKSAKLNTE